MPSASHLDHAKVRGVSPSALHSGAAISGADSHDRIESGKGRYRMSRAVHIDGVEYPYKVNGAGVRIRMPDRKCVFIDTEEFTGQSPDEQERAQWKGYVTPITPAMIKEKLKEILKA